MKTEEWPALFTQHLNAGHLESVTALYAPNARFVSPAGELFVGCAGISEQLDQLIRADTSLRSKVVQVIVVDDVAL